MPDIGAISVSFGADTSDYESKVLQLMRRTAAAAEGMQEFAEAQGQAAAATKAAAGAASSSAGGGWTELNSQLQLVAQAAHLVEQAVMASINAANEIDPSGAAEWNKHVNALHQTFVNLAGTVGKELRPALEAVMDAARQTMQLIARIDFARLWKDAKQGASDLAKWITDVLQEAAVKSAQIILAPFQMMFDLIVGIMTKALDTASEMASSLAGILGSTLTEKLKAQGIDLNGISKGLAGTSQGVKQAAQDNNFGKVAVESFEKLASVAASAVTSTATEVVKGALANAGSFYSQYLKAPGNEVHVAGSTDAGQAQAASIARGIDAWGAKYADMVTAAQAKAAEGAMAVSREGALSNAALAISSYKTATDELNSAYARGDVSALEQARQHVDSARAAVDIAENGVLLEDDKRMKAAQAAADYFAKASADAKVAADAANADLIAKAQAAANAPQDKALQIEAQTAQQIAGIKQATADRLQAKEIETAQQAVSLKVAGAHDEADILNKANERMKAETQARKDYERQASLVRAAGDTLVGNISGSAGGLAKAAQAGLESGDPVKALVEAAVSIVAKSKGFQDLLTSLNTLIDSVGGALGQLFEGLSPLISIIGQDLAPVLRAVGDVLQVVTSTAGQVLGPLLSGLAPMLEVIGQLVEAFAPLIAISVQLVFLVSGLQPVLIAAGEALRLLAPLIGYLADGVKFVVDAIAGAWNWVIGEVQSLLMELAKLPYVGDVFKDLANGLNSMVVQTDYATTSVGAFAQAVQDAAAKVGSTRQAADDAAAKVAMLRDVQAQVRAGDGHNDYQVTSADQALIDELGKEIIQAQKEADAAALQARLAYDQNVLATVQQMGQTGQALARAQAAVQADQEAVLLAGATANIANTEATRANTAATQAFAESVSNLPQFFNLNAVRSGVLGDGGTLPGLGGSSGGITISGDITVVANDPEALLKQLEAQASRASYRRSGTLGTPGRNLTQP